MWHSVHRKWGWAGRKCQHVEHCAGRPWCPRGDVRAPRFLKQAALHVFPKTERTSFGFLVLLRTSLFWVSLSSCSLFSWVHVEDHVCLLDCIVVDLQDMDIFAAERRPREYSKASDDSSGDLIFPSYFVRQTGGSLLTEPCRLKLQVERNLDK